MISRFPCFLIATAVCSGWAAAEPKPTPTPDQGKVDSGGRFVPAASAVGGAAASPLMTREEAEAALRKDLKIETLSPTRMRIGEVTLDRSDRTVRFRATVNMTKGQVEYALVTDNGKRHESIFTTKVSPRDVHLAMLLLGVRPQAVQSAAKGEVQNAPEASTTVSVEWETNGPRKKHPLSALVSLTDGSPDQVSTRTLKDGPWLYTGSVFDAGGFAALREGSLISLIGDPVALVGSLAKERDNDDIHVPNSTLLPAVGMPVTIVLTCPKLPDGGK